MYELSKKSAQNLDNILDFSAQNFGVEKMIKYYQSLTQCFELLDKNPKIGINSEHIRNGYFCFYHQSHVFFYQLKDKGIFIVRVLHKSMNVVKRFGL